MSLKGNWSRKNQQKSLVFTPKTRQTLLTLIEWLNWCCVCIERTFTPVNPLLSIYEYSSKTQQLVIARTQPSTASFQCIELIAFFSFYCVLRLQANVLTRLLRILMYGKNVNRLHACCLYHRYVNVWVCYMNVTRGSEISNILCCLYSVFCWIVAIVKFGCTDIWIDFDFRKPNKFIKRCQIRKSSFIQKFYSFLVKITFVYVLNYISLIKFNVLTFFNQFGINWVILKKVSKMHQVLSLNGFCSPPFGSATTTSASSATIETTTTT